MSMTSARNHQRPQLEALVEDVEQPLAHNGPWPYHLSPLYYTPEVSAAVPCLATTARFPQAA